MHYKMCTISWLNSLVRPLQVVGEMETGTGTEGEEAQDGLAILVPLVLLVFLFPVSSFGQDKIQAYVSQGKLVYTNLVDNTPQPPAPILAQTTDGLASEVPPSLRNLVDTI